MHALLDQAAAPSEKALKQVFFPHIPPEKRAFPECLLSSIQEIPHEYISPFERGKGEESARNKMTEQLKPNVMGGKENHVTLFLADLFLPWILQWIFRLRGWKTIAYCFDDGDAMAFLVFYNFHGMFSYIFFSQCPDLLADEWVCLAPWAQIFTFPSMFILYLREVSSSSSLLEMRGRKSHFSSPRKEAIFLFDQRREKQLTKNYEQHLRCLRAQRGQLGNNFALIHFEPNLDNSDIN